MTTPAFYARVHPSEVDRVPEWRVAQIFEETRVRLAAAESPAPAPKVDGRKLLRVSGRPSFIAGVKKMAGRGKCLEEISRALHASKCAVRRCAAENDITIPAFDARKNGYALNRRLGRSEANRQSHWRSARR